MILKTSILVLGFLFIAATCSKYSKEKLDQAISAIRADENLSVTDKRVKMLFEDPETWGLNSTALLGIMTSAQFHGFIKYIANNTGKDEDFLLQKDIDNVYAYLAKISRPGWNILNEFAKAGEEHCKILAYVVDGIRPNEVPIDCATSILNELATTEKLHLEAKKALVKHLPRILFANQIVATLDTLSKMDSAESGIVQYLSSEQLTMLNAKAKSSKYSKNVCAYVSAAGLDKLEDDSVVKLMNPYCIASLKDLATTALDDTIQTLGDKAFERSEKLSPQTFASLSQTQVQFFNAVNRKNIQKYCHGLEPTALNENAAGLEQDCFFGWLRVQPTTIAKLGEDFWKTVTFDFANLHKSYYKILRKLPAEEYEYMGSKRIENILMLPVGAKGIPGDAKISLKNPISIDAPRFFKMAPELQVFMLVNIGSLVEAPADLLAELNAKHVEQWVGYESSEIEATGIEIFAELESLNKSTLLRTMVTRMGTKNLGPHVCSKIMSVEELKQLKLIRENMNERCIAALPFRFDIESPELFFAQPREKWGNDSAEIEAALKEFNLEALSKLVGNGNSRFCAQINAKEFHLIPKPALSAMSFECLEQFNRSGLSKDLMREEVQAFSATIFAKADASFFKNDGLNLKHISNEQLPHLSSNIEEAKNAVILFDKEMVSLFDTSKLTPVQWGLIQPNAYAGINTGDKFAAIPGPAMARMRYDQVIEIPKEVRAKLTKEQAEQIGVSVDRKNSPIKAFVEVLGQLRPEVRTIISSRNSSSRLVAPVSVAMIIAAAAVLIA